MKTIVKFKPAVDMTGNELHVTLDHSEGKTWLVDIVLYNVRQISNRWANVVEYAPIRLANIDQISEFQQLLEVAKIYIRANGADMEDAQDYMDKVLSKKYEGDRWVETPRKVAPEKKEPDGLGGWRWTGFRAGDGSRVVGEASVQLKKEESKEEKERRELMDL